MPGLQIPLSRARNLQGTPLFSPVTDRGGVPILARGMNLLHLPHFPAIGLLIFGLTAPNLLSSLSAHEIFSTSFAENPSHGWRAGIDDASNNRVSRNISTDSLLPGIRHAGLGSSTGRGWKSTFRHFGESGLETVHIAPGQSLIIEFDWQIQDTASAATRAQVAVFAAGSFTPNEENPEDPTGYSAHFHLNTTQSQEARTSIMRAPWNTIEEPELRPVPEGWERNAVRRLRFTLHRFSPEQMQMTLSDVTGEEQILNVAEDSVSPIVDLNTILFSVRRTFSADVSQLDRFDHVSVHLKNPQPVEITGAEVLPTGAISLQWEIPPYFTGSEVFRIDRATGDPEDPSAFESIGETTGTAFIDRATGPDNLYTYRVVPIDDNGQEASPSDWLTLRVDQVTPPLVGARFSAEQTPDGTLFRWAPHPKSRGQTVRIIVREEKSEGVVETVIGEFPLSRGEATIAGLDPEGIYGLIILDQKGEESGTRMAGITGTIPFNDNLDAPREHPLLLLSEQDVAAILDRVDTDPLYRHAYENGLLADAEEAFLASGPDELSIPTERSPQHEAIARDTQRLALGYRFSGDTRYAEAARTILLYYGDNYSSYPIQQPWVDGRLTHQTLNEAMLLIYLTWSYDLLHDTFTPAERQRIESGLLREGAEVVNTRDRGNSNWQAWHNAATGMIGFVLNDSGMIDRAISGPNGFRDHLKHALLPDGLWHEQSIDYHYFTLHALTYLAEAAYRNGIDLYRLQRGERILKLAYDAPLYHSFSSLNQPVFGNSAPHRRLVAPDMTWNYAVAYARYGDPNYRWFWNKDSVLSTRLTGEIHYPPLLCLYLLDSPEPNQPPAPFSYHEPFTGDDGSQPTDWVYLVKGDGMGLWEDRLLFRRDNSESSTFWRSAAYFGEDSHHWTDYTASVWFSDSHQHQSSNQPVGILARIQPGQINQGAKFGGYFAYYQNGQLRIDRDFQRSGGGDLLASSPVAQALLPGEEYQLRFILSGENLEVRLFDDSGGLIGLVRATDDFYRSGPPGVRAYHSYWSRETRFRDFSVEGVLQERKESRPRFSIGTSQVGPSIRNSWGSTLLSGVGLAVLRSNPGVVAPEVALTWKPYGSPEGHQHPDNLSIHWESGAHRWLPGIGNWLAYDDPIHRDWVKTSLSKNTLLVDRSSQYPAFAGAPSFFFDEPGNPSSGSLNTFFAGPAFRFVDAETERVYEDVVLRRRLIHSDAYTLDIFSARSDRPRVFDWVLHPNGALASSSHPLTATEAPIAPDSGYPYIEDLREGTTSDTWQTAWSHHNQFLRIQVLGAPDTRTFTGRGPWQNGSRGVLIASRTAEAASFVSLIAAAEDKEPAIQAEWIEEPPTSEYVSRGAVKVTDEALSDHIFWADQKETFQSGAFSGTAHTWVLRLNQSDLFSSAMMVRGTEITGPDLGLKTTVEATLEVATTRDHEAWILHYGEAFPQSVFWRSDKPITVEVLDESGRRVGEIPAVNGPDGWFAWTATPHASYSISPASREIAPVPMRLRKDFPEWGLTLEAERGHNLGENEMQTVNTHTYGAEDRWSFFYLEVEEPVGKLTVTAEGAESPIGILLRRQIKPTLDFHDYTSGDPGTGTQTATVYQPEAGRWWIGIRTIVSGTLHYTLQHLQSRPHTSFEGWQAYHFGPTDTDSATAAPTADPFATGLPNLIRYALGLGPTDEDLSRRPRVTIVSNGAEKQLAFSHTELTEASDLEYKPEMSHDLIHWHPWESERKILESGETVQWIQHIDPEPLDDHSARFYRLRVIHRKDNSGS